MKKNKKMISHFEGCSWSYSINVIICPLLQKQTKQQNQKKKRNKGWNLKPVQDCLHFDSILSPNILFKIENKSLIKKNKIISKNLFHDLLDVSFGFWVVELHPTSVHVLGIERPFHRWFHIINSSWGLQPPSVLHHKPLSLVELHFWGVLMRLK